MHNYTVMSMRIYCHVYIYLLVGAHVHGVSIYMSTNACIMNIYMCVYIYLY